MRQDKAGLASFRVDFQEGSEFSVFFLLFCKWAGKNIADFSVSLYLYIN